MKNKAWILFAVCLLIGTIFIFYPRPKPPPPTYGHLSGSIIKTQPESKIPVAGEVEQRIIVGKKEYIKKVKTKGTVIVKEDGERIEVEAITEPEPIVIPTLTPCNEIGVRYDGQDYTVYYRRDAGIFFGELDYTIDQKQFKLNIGLSYKF